MSDTDFEIDKFKDQLPLDETVKLSEFAVNHFQYGEDHVHTDCPIRKSLLPLGSTSDNIAALAISVNILGFMGDLQYSTDNPDSNKTTDTKPIMTRILSTIGDKFTQTNLEEAKMMNVELARPSTKRVRVSTTEGRKSTMKGVKFLSVRERKTSVDDFKMDFVTPRGRNVLLDDILVSEIDLIQFIVGQGILRSDVRDEIYCQIIKQLTKNPSEASYDRGWILLALCLGCFTPSKKFIKYVQSFIVSGPASLVAHCREILRRTFANGNRNQPPSRFELESVKSNTPLILPITFMDGSTKSLKVDSATTSGEICQQLSDKIGLQDRFGFSLFIAMDGQVTSLGSGGDHVFDAISQCEQITRMKEIQTDSKWRLFFKKEIYVPWHDPSDDLIATNLIYQQIIRGVKFGEYRCDKDEDLAMILAKQYYVDYGDYGSTVNCESLRVLIPSYIPRTHRNEKESFKYWSHLIVEKIKTLQLANRKTERQKIKEELVSYAKDKWQLSFSRYFEAYKFVEQGLPKNDVVIAVNCTGVYVVDEQDQVLLQLCYTEISAVYNEGSDAMTCQYVQLHTISGEKYTFLSLYSGDVRNLVMSILDGLKKRSTFAVALRDYSPEGEITSSVSFKQGDMILLRLSNDDNVINSGWCFGECPSNATKGHFPRQHIYLLPTITKPTQTLLNPFVKSDIPDLTADEITENEDKEHHTLEQYAHIHFRFSQKRSLLHRIASSRRRQQRKLWRFSNESLKQPLLNNLADKSFICEEACKCFSAIQQYMGDSQLISQDPGELVYKIIGTPLRWGVLKDELYCQIIKQLTENKIKTSKDRGLELMWLITGCFIPSADLLNEVNAFLRSSRDEVAQDCLKRLQKTLRYGERRYPPLQVEVEAVQHKMYKVFQKVNFPNGSDEFFEVESNARARVMCKNISSKLKLNSNEGFCLYVKMGDKAISVPESDILFDFISCMSEWIHRSTTHGPRLKFTYQVFFMKKIWTNTVPGRDMNADLIFHYHQELPQLLRGYHKCSREEAVRLAALIFRVKFGNVNTNLGNIRQSLQDLVPTHLVETLAADEWSKKIADYCKLDGDMTQDDAKLIFLKYIHKWPFSGSAFFDIKQPLEFGYLEKLFMAINDEGVHLIRPDTKHVLRSIPFKSIANWRASDCHFHLIIGDLIRGNRMNFETKKGYEIDDLLSTYIERMITNQNEGNTIVVADPVQTEYRCLHVGCTCDNQSFGYGYFIEIN